MNTIGLKAKEAREEMLKNVKDLSVIQYTNIKTLIEDTVKDGRDSISVLNIYPEVKKQLLAEGFGISTLSGTNNTIIKW
jgi:hypothetical protein